LKEDNKLKKTIKKITGYIINVPNKETVRVCMATVIVLVVMLCTYIFFPVSFETNDDSGMMYILAGYRTGQPEVGTVYCNILWDSLICFCYRIFPRFPCYVAVFVLVLFISNMLILKSFLRIAAQKCGIWKGVLAYVVFYCLYINCSVVFLQFTTLSIIAGMASYTVILSSFRQESRTVRIIDFMSIVLMLFLSYIIRAKVGYVMICWCMFATLSRLYIEKRIYRDRVIRFAGVLAAVVILFAGALFIHNAYYSDEEWTKYRAYSAQRGRYTDYPHLSWDEMETKYREAGWTKELYELVRYWFFMDPAVNTDSFTVINQANQALQNIVPIKQRIFNAARAILSLVESEDKVFIELVGVCYLAFILSVYYLKHKEYFPLLYMWGAISFSCVLTVYLALEGRVIFRVFQMCILPVAVLLFWNGLEQTVHKGNFLMPKGIVRVGLCLFIILSVLCVRQTKIEAYACERLRDIENKKALESYFMENLDNIYIYDCSFRWVSDPTTVFAQEKPTNYFFWGGASMFSPVYYKQLRLNGREELYANCFFEENVYLVSKDSALTEYLALYLSERYKCSVEILVVDKVQECNIIKLKCNK